jgi:RNase P subunit RPR2
MHVIVCKRCQCPLGQTDGQVLYLGPVRVLRLITMECVCCGERRRWEPGKRIAELTQACYTELVSV